MKENQDIRIRLRAYDSKLLDNSASEIVNTDKWEDIYILLKEYFVENNHVDVPNNYESTDGFKLGAWVSRQRARYKSGKLSEERIEKLESLGFKWER